MSRYRSGNYSIARKITRHYSTSFSLGISRLKPEIRNAICAIYAYVRYADEIVDTFHFSDKKSLLRKYRSDTWEALEGKISSNPVLDAFQETVHRYKIPKHYIESFLDSMETDLEKKYFSKAELDLYIYGSAEVVGLMCLKVFVRDDKEFNLLENSAKALGAAFQKVNFLRDIKSDFEERGRVYFPSEYYTGDQYFTNFSKKKFELEIREDFKNAMEGIKRLPSGCRTGVYLAYTYYYRLFVKMQKYEIEELLKSRIRINNFNKAYLFGKSILLEKINMK
jgi:phytoene/squalene synthetase